MARKAGEDNKPDKMPSSRLWWLGCFSRSFRMGQSPQYNQRNEIKAWYRDPFSFHTRTDHDGANSTIRKQNGRGPTYKREKYMNLTKELENAGYKAVVMPVEVGARGFVGSSVYDLLTKLSICGNKRTKALKLLAEIAENSSRWIWSRRNERFLHKD